MTAEVVSGDACIPDKLPQLVHLRPHSLSALLVLHLLNLVGFLVQGTFLQIKWFAQDGARLHAMTLGFPTCVTGLFWFLS